MFEAVINAGVLKDSLDTISQLIGEGNLKVGEDGLRLEAVDRGMVAFVDLHISKEAFDSFQADKEQNIGLNLENLLSMIKHIKGDDISGKIKLGLSEDGRRLNVTNIKYLPPSKKDGAPSENYRSNFFLPLIEIPKGEIIDLSKLKPPAKIQLECSFLEECITTVGSISDHVVIEATPDSFYIKAEGNGRKIEMRANRGKAAISINSQDTVKSSFSLEYLKKMMKASKISDVVSMELGKDYPMKLEFKQPDRVRISFVLAPRVEE